MTKGKVHKKEKKKLIKIIFRYVHVAENFEKLVFLFFFSQHTLNRQVSLGHIWGQKGKKLVFTGRRYV